MSPKFIKSVEFTFGHEGGYNNHIEDTGGATNWGISLNFLKTLGLTGDKNQDKKIDYLDIKMLEKHDALKLYYDNFWKPVYDKLQAKVAIKLFDTAVNAGHRQAHILLQRSLNSLGSKIPVDGLIGEVTIKECFKYKEEQILFYYTQHQMDFYKDIVTKKPSQKKFLKGWISRAKSIPV